MVADWSTNGNQCKESQQMEKLKRAEAITMLDSDSAEQDEPQLNAEPDAATKNSMEVKTHKSNDPMTVYAKKSHH